MTIPTDPVIGVDVGASTISAGLVCPDGTVFAAAQAPTRGGGPVVDTIFALIDRVRGAADGSRCRVAGSWATCRSPPSSTREAATPSSSTTT